MYVSNHEIESELIVSEASVKKKLTSIARERVLFIVGMIPARDIFLAMPYFLRRMRIARDGGITPYLWFPPYSSIFQYWNVFKTPNFLNMSGCVGHGDTHVRLTSVDSYERFLNLIEEHTQVKPVVINQRHINGYHVGASYGLRLRVIGEDEISTVKTNHSGSRLQSRLAAKEAFNLLLQKLDAQSRCIRHLSTDPQFGRFVFFYPHTWTCSVEDREWIDLLHFIRKSWSGGIICPDLPWFSQEFHDELYRECMLLPVKELHHIVSMLYQSSYFIGGEGIVSQIAISIGMPNLWIIDSGIDDRQYRSSDPRVMYSETIDTTEEQNQKKEIGDPNVKEGSRKEKRKFKVDSDFSSKLSEILAIKDHGY